MKLEWWCLMPGRYTSKCHRFCIVKRKRHWALARAGKWQADFSKLAEAKVHAQKQMSHV
jgi:hypothetical protein